MTAQSTLRHNLSGHDCSSLASSKDGGVARILAKRDCSAHRIPHFALTLDRQAQCYISHESLKAAASIVKLRFMRTAHSAWHWSNIYAATSVQLDLPLGPDNHACILVGPFDLRVGMFPVGCTGWVGPQTQLKGEVDVDWLKYYAASPACMTMRGTVTVPRREERTEEEECVICMDDLAVFSWGACNHNRALLCRDCTEKTKKQSRQVATRCVLCRRASNLVSFQTCLPGNPEGGKVDS